MTGRRQLRQMLEVALGLAPATFLLLPFLLAGALGTVLAAASGGAIHLATATLIAWALAGAAGIAALWVAVLSDGTAGNGPRARLTLTLGLLLGMAAAARWVWVMCTSGHRYGAVTWAVWLALLGGPLVVAGFRLAQLWGSPHPHPHPRNPP
jgi:hypothetical protein